MNIRAVLRAFFVNVAKSVQLQAETREGIANLADLINRRLEELIELQAHQGARNEQLLRGLAEGLANQTDVLNERLMELVEGVANQTDVLNERLKALAAQKSSVGGMR
jgi:uncharacterized protein with von Willebrand factor type A (vWA) domain